MQRLAILVTLFSLTGCGRIGPGAASRPAATGEAPSGNYGNGSGGGSGAGSVYDDKGCANGVGDSGKALLAFQEDDALRHFHDPLPTFTPRTIGTLAQLRGELEQVRARGFAINRGEWRDSVCRLGAIVQDGTGKPVAAISISGPADRLKLSVLRRFSAVVVDTARNLSRALGHNPALRMPALPGRPGSRTAATLKPCQASAAPSSDRDRPPPAEV